MFSFSLRQYYAFISDIFLFYSFYFFFFRVSLNFYCEFNLDFDLFTIINFLFGVNIFDGDGDWILPVDIKDDIEGIINFFFDCRAELLLLLLLLSINLFDSILIWCYCGANCFFD